MRKTLFYLVAASVFAAGCNGDRSADDVSGSYADIVVFGDIFTSEEVDGGEAGAFAVKDGRYLYVGDRETASSYIKQGVTEVIDRTGNGLVIPGCTEGHAHFIMAEEEKKLILSGSSFDEIADNLLQWVAEHPDDGQVITFGLDDRFMRYHPAGINYASELEKYAPGIPVLMSDGSGHGMLVNETALRMAGLWKTGPTVRGGVIELDESGYPTGFVFDQALPFMFRNAMTGPVLSYDEICMACRDALAELNRRGYTNYLDAWLNMLNDSDEYRCLSEIELTAYVAACYNIQSYNTDSYKEEVDRVAVLAEKYSNGHFNPSYIKLFVDGVTEGRTGWLFTPYPHPVNQESMYGNRIWTQEELENLTSYANSKGITIHSHTFGDAACNAMIDAYIAAGSRMRNTLAHVRNITVDDVERIVRDGNIGVAENMIWHWVTQDYISAINEILPSEYVDGYPMKSLSDAGVRFCSSTDAPAAEDIEGNIVNVIYVSVNGIAPDAADCVPFDTDELITVREALKALTIDGAWTLGIDDVRGSIKEGKYADFVILDKNLLTCLPEEIKDARVERTYFEGCCVYSGK